MDDIIENIIEGWQRGLYDAGVMADKLAALGQYDSLDWDEVLS